MPPITSEQNRAHSGKLLVLIIGAGISGLTAALALRQHGHQVQVYEQSRFVNELGAGIHVSPNANGVLRRMGLRLEDWGAVKLLQTKYYDASLRLLSTVNDDAQSHRWQATWYSTHRGHLHTQLKEAATSVRSVGPPALIHTSSRVASVDGDTATICLSDGSYVQGDVLVGADGVHSVCRFCVAGPGFDSFNFGKNAFRFMIPREQVLQDPQTREFGQGLGTMSLIFSSQHKVIVYPCVDNTMLNFVCIHPAHLSTAAPEDYNTPVSKAKLLEVFQEFDPLLLRLFDKCDSESLRVYPLFDGPTLPTFTKGRLALIGDAAHPFTPFIGQGGAMAIEDAVSLGVMLSENTSAEEIPVRLQLYDLARHRRATTVQSFSRLAGSDGVVEGAGDQSQMRGKDAAYYAIAYDEYHASTQLLREHRWKKEPLGLWLQPTVFGPMPGLFGDKAVGGKSTSGCTSMTVARITFNTSGTLLRNLLPTKQYCLVALDTVAPVTISVLSYRNATSQNRDEVRIEIPGVAYQPTDRALVRGRYLPVVFENSAQAITANREKFAFPSVFSDIEANSSAEGAYSITLSEGGTVWATLWLNGLQPQHQRNVHRNAIEGADAGLLVQRYVPGVVGIEDVVQDLVVSDDSMLPGPSDSLDECGSARRVSSLRVTTTAGVDIRPGTTGELPIIHHIVARLAELPVLAIRHATLQTVEGYQDCRKAYAASAAEG